MRNQVARHDFNRASVHADKKDALNSRQTQASLLDEAHEATLGDLLEHLVEDYAGLSNKPKDADLINWMDLTYPRDSVLMTMGNKFPLTWEQVRREISDAPAPFFWPLIQREEGTKFSLLIPDGDNLVDKGVFDNYTDAVTVCLRYASNS